MKNNEFFLHGWERESVSGDFQRKLGFAFTRNVLQAFHQKPSCCCYRAYIGIGTSLVKECCMYGP